MSTADPSSAREHNHAQQESLPASSGRQRWGEVLRKEGAVAFLYRAALKVLSGMHARLYISLEQRLRSRRAPEGQGAEHLPAALEPAPETSHPIGALQPPVPPKPVPDPVILHTSDRPTVSLIVFAAGHDQALPTLESLARFEHNRVLCEVLVIVDASQEKAGTFDHVQGIRLIDGAADKDPAAKWNRAVQVAQGDWICLLPPDVRAKGLWLESLLEVAGREPLAVMIGPRVVTPDGWLRDAGLLVWNDGQVWPFGKLDGVAEPEYTYLRAVDACPCDGALIRRDAFLGAGGFSPWWHTAPYRDADLCFRLAPGRLFHQPLAEVVDYSTAIFATEPPQGSDADRQRFAEQWAEQLAERPSPDPAQILAASRSAVRHRRTTLVIDSYVPVHDREAGSLRLLHIVKLLCEQGGSVIFLPQNGLALQPYTSQLQQMGVEVLYPTPKQSSLDRQLRDRLPLIDFAWICRPEIFGEFYPVLREKPSLKLVYDTIDLHFIRLRRQWELDRSDVGAAELSRTYRYLELGYARLAAATVVVSPAEQQRLRRFGVPACWVVPTVHPRYSGARPSYSEREGLLFIGGYGHPPNVDAALWLCREIMPRVWESLPDVTLTLLGYNPPPEIRSLESSRVRVPGYVQNVDDYFLGSRVFVAPLRFGAGINGKIGQSLSFGLPVVTTPVGAEGIGLEDGISGLVACDATEFAAAVVRAYTQQCAWERLSEGAWSHLKRFQPEAIGHTLTDIFDYLSNSSSSFS